MSLRVLILVLPILFARSRSTTSSSSGATPAGGGKAMRLDVGRSRSSRMNGPRLSKPMTPRSWLEWLLPTFMVPLTARRPSAALSSCAMRLIPRPSSATSETKTGMSGFMATALSPLSRHLGVGRWRRANVLANTVERTRKLGSSGTGAGKW
jgi:hypothetical protein